MLKRMERQRLAQSSLLLIEADLAWARFGEMVENDRALGIEERRFLDHAGWEANLNELRRLKSLGVEV